jgi:hypothetical protein
LNSRKYDVPRNVIFAVPVADRITLEPYAVTGQDVAKADEARRFSVELSRTKPRTHPLIGCGCKLSVDETSILPEEVLIVDNTTVAAVKLAYVRKTEFALVTEFKTVIESTYSESTVDRSNNEDD